MLDIARQMRARGAAYRGDTIADAVAHLDRLLNSRRGLGISAPDYGSSLSRDDVRDALTQLPYSLPLLEQAVLQAVTAHEPRLHQWRLWQPSVVGAQALTLYLWAQLSDGPQQSVRIDVVMLPCGRMKAQLL